jgi:hypothetical protein
LGTTPSIRRFYNERSGIIESYDYDHRRAA